jgi:hypothetical protein
LSLVLLEQSSISIRDVGDGLSSIFPSINAGDGWSARFEDGILHGCIPVIIMDNVQVMEHIAAMSRMNVSFRTNPHLIEYHELSGYLSGQVSFDLIYFPIISYQVPFESILNIEAFTVRILQKDIPRILEILGAISEAKVEEMRSHVHKVWQRYEDDGA